jgi:2-hydroxy-3-oxopropionate reductase
MTEGAAMTTRNGPDTDEPPATQPPERTVGVIGLGQMGGAMTRTLLGAGWRVVAWDLAAPLMEAARAAGAEIAADPQDLARRCATVVTSLPDAAAVRTVVLGEHGLAAAGRRDLLVADTSTTTPAEARALAAACAEQRISFLDSPVTGGPAGAANAALGIMVGGDAAAFARAKPLFEVLGATIVHCGASGTGQVVKACNQLIVVATLGAVAEALVTARAAGVDPWVAREVLLAGYAASPILAGQGERMLRRDFAPGGKARFNVKDAVTLVQVSAETGIPLPVFGAAAGYIDALVAAGGGDLDHSAIVTVIDPGWTSAAEDATREAHSR